MPYLGNIYYDEKGTGRPIVLLHGNGEAHTLFTLLFEALAEDYHVIAPDSPGHGLSAPTLNYSYEPMAREIASFLKAKLEEPCLIVGFSDGGILSFYLARFIPDLIAGIMPLGANIFPEGLTEEGLREIRENYALTGDPLLRLLLEEPKLTPEDLAKIRIPALVVAGEHDLIAEPHTRLIARSLPNAELLILEGETHASYVAHTDRLAPLIRAFAGRLNREPHA